MSNFWGSLQSSPGADLPVFIISVTARRSGYYPKAAGFFRQCHALGMRLFIQTQMLAGMESTLFLCLGTEGHGLLRHPQQLVHILFYKRGHTVPIL